MNERQVSNFEYATAPESTSIVNIKSEYGLFINGKFVAPKSGKRFATINPATEEVLSKVAYADLADVNLAVNAARSALLQRMLAEMGDGAAFDVCRSDL